MRHFSLACLLSAAAAYTVPCLPMASMPRASPKLMLSVDSTLALLAEAGEAPPMADGAVPVAIAGGLVAILTAGLPILFLGGDKESDADKLAGLEQGIGSMEIEVEEDSDDDTTGPPPKQALI
jgi:hypothetical protein|uniref:PSII 6.1 kDa protein n=1 Tax=Haptolina ericina TaxID=156174 RepID=A0A7S3ESZ0_9EUKA|mmetsp:Transcript_15783/g.35425  ORF Transcript_15783/g.35425 Transcript_15783/m.35425 type:complete len:123 (+) Transcript_15783:23-391(+)